MLKRIKNFSLYISMALPFFLGGCQDAKSKKQTPSCQNQSPCCDLNCATDCSDCFTQSCRTGKCAKR